MIALFRTLELQPEQLGASQSIVSAVLWAPQILQVNEITRFQSTPNLRRAKFRDCGYRTVHPRGSPFGFVGTQPQSYRIFGPTPKRLPNFTHRDSVTPRN